MATIELRNIDRIFSGGVKAVDNLSITIESGHFVSLLGPSGCGKTTSLRMIAGLDAPDGGEILLDGKPLYSKKAGIAVPTEKRGMGLVFQSYALWPHMTIAQNISFGLEMKGMEKHQRIRRVAEVMDLMHITDLEKRYPSQISGGQQQRVALARNLAVSPDVLLLDEPLSNLDAKLRLEMRAELKRLHETLKNTIVYVTHDQLEAMTMSTMIAVMSQGKLKQYAPPMEIYRKPANLTVAGFVGSPPMNFLRRGDCAKDSPWDLGILACHPDLAKTATTIGVRPEDIQLAFPGSQVSTRHEGAESHWVCKAKVETVLPTGSEWVVDMVAGTSHFYASVRDEPCCLDAGEVDMVVEREAFHLFDDKEIRCN
jgi:iron(III) transport system ATP-binding protein